MRPKAHRIQHPRLSSISKIEILYRRAQGEAKLRLIEDRKTARRELAAALRSRLTVAGY